MTKAEQEQVERVRGNMKSTIGDYGAEVMAILGVSARHVSAEQSRKLVKITNEATDEAIFTDGLLIKHPDQKAPDNIAWHKNDREYEAYCAGHNDVILAGFVRVIKEAHNEPD